MPRYKFQVHDGHSKVAPDIIDLPDVLSARREGIRRAGVALILDARHLEPSGQWRLDVTDENGLMLYSMDFSITAAPAAR